MQRLDVNSPSFQLLLSCSKLQPGESEVSKRNEAFAKGIDWDDFIFLTDRHLVSPMVYHQLRSDERVPHHVADVLKKRALSNQLQVLQAQRFQVLLQEFCQSESISIVFLKGITIAHQFYGDMALRHFADIDCWIDPMQLEKVTGFLNENGYAIDQVWQGLTKRQYAHLKNVDYHFHFRATRPNLPSIIELHWRLMDRQGNFSFDPMLENESLTAIPIGSFALVSLNEMDHFIYLCVHGAKHGWYRLKWFFDLPQVLANTNFDWNEVLLRAAVLDAKEQVLSACQLMHELLEWELPQPIVEASLNEDHGFEIRYFKSQILLNEAFGKSLSEKFLRFFFLLRQNRDSLFRGIFWQKNLTGPEDWKLLPLPDSLFFLYFPLRPFLWAWRGIRRLQIR